MSLGLGHGVGMAVFIINPMALVHCFHHSCTRIRNRSRNKRPNMWIGWFVSSWCLCSWSEFSQISLCISDHGYIPRHVGTHLYASPGLNDLKPSDTMYVYIYIYIYIYTYIYSNRDHVAIENKDKFSSFTEPMHIWFLFLFHLNGQY